MKKTIKFTKKYWLYILLAVVIVAALVAGFLLLHHIATAERGYEAIGGEISVFAIPLIVYATRKNIQDTKEALGKKE